MVLFAHPCHMEWPPNSGGLSWSATGRVGVSSLSEPVACLSLRLGAQVSSGKMVERLILCKACLRAAPLDPRRTLPGLGGEGSPHRSGEARKGQMAGESLHSCPRVCWYYRQCLHTAKRGLVPHSSQPKVSRLGQVCTLSHHHHQAQALVATMPPTCSTP